MVMLFLNFVQIKVKKTSYKSLIMDSKIIVLMITVIVSATVLPNIAFANDTTNTDTTDMQNNPTILYRILQRLDSILAKLTIIANQDGGRNSASSVAISLKCNWASNASVDVDYVGHCNPQLCPGGFQSVATNDVKLNWIPRTAWGYTERWCVK